MKGETILTKASPNKPEEIEETSKGKRKAKDTTEIQGITAECFEKIYSNKQENLEEMDKFLGTYHVQKLTQ